jgi:hypothetical protein
MKKAFTHLEAMGLLDVDSWPLWRGSSSMPSITSSEVSTGTEAVLAPFSPWPWNSSGGLSSVG